MALIDMLAGAQGGAFFANAAAASGLGAVETRTVFATIGPAIAGQLKGKAEADPESFEDLLDLLEDGGDSDLDDGEAMTGAEAVADGNAILAAIYGSRNAAIVDMRKLAGDIPEVPLEKIAAIAATSVLAALARSHAVAQPPAGATTAAATEGGLLGTIVSAIVKGAVQGAASQLAPRRRRSYSSYFGKRRRRTARGRRRTRSPSLDDIFADILGTRRC
ncbi:MAG: DUF937 domain-containing protein [Hyphomicrobiales bacterium]